MSPAIIIVLVAGITYGVFSLMLRPKKRQLFPIWATLEIALTTFLLSRGGIGKRILSSIRRYGGSVFGLTSSHQLLVNAAGADRLLSQSHQVVSAGPVHYTLLIRVFGGTDTPELRSKYLMFAKETMPAIERVYLNDTAATSEIERANVPDKAASLVSFSDNPKLMRRWELSASIRVVKQDLPSQPGAVEANLQSLTRDFGACIAIPLLYGQDFLDRSPLLLDDFWRFDNDLFPLLMIGVPSWLPIKMLREGLASRSRLIDELEALYRRIDQYQRGEAVDFGADMSDVGSIALNRSKLYKRDGWSMKRRGVVDMTIIWGQNANTQPVLFWFLAYIYSTSDLVHQLRQEIVGHVRLSETTPAEITSMDIAALSRHCPLLKACLFETYRLTVEATSIRQIEQPTTLNATKQKHDLKPGSFISVLHSLNQRDPLVYDDPNTFSPGRFLETDANSGNPVARYGKLKPWGAGGGMCKGRTFAEKELLTVAAALISLWDISPVGGVWKLPDMLPGTGVKKPVEDIRVVITRRGSD